MTQAEVDWATRAQAAERTVEVLKRKVLAMYAGETQSALHRALEVAKQRDERNGRRRELMEVRTDELAKHNALLEMQVARRAHAIKVILDNVTCGFLRIDGNGGVQEGWSHSCGELFGCTELSGSLQLVELLGISGTPRGVEFQLGVDQVFEDILPEEVTLAQMQGRFEVKSKVLSVEGRLIRDAAGNPESILYTVSDSTELEKARAESREREVLIGILRRKVAFEQFVEDVSNSLEAASKCLDDQQQLRRVVHTIKGNAASWGLGDIVRTAHLVEERSAIGGHDLEALESSVRTYLDRNFELLAVSYDTCEPAYAVLAEDIRVLRALATEPGHLNEIVGWVTEVLRRPALEFLGPIQVFAERLAERLGKSVALEIEGGEVGVDAEIVGPVLRNVCHLVRNAIDHGIEAECARGEKPAQGRVALQISEDDSSWSIAVTDDGRGVQTELLIERAVERGAITREEASRLSHEEQVALMFVEGLSTAASATEVSGRGVGMSAVRDCVLQAGGSIATTTGSDGTKIVLSVPRGATQLARDRSAPLPGVASTR